MKKIFLAILLYLFSCTITFSQGNLNNQVLVYFKTGIQRVSPTNTTSSISSQNILNTLNAYGIPTANVVPTFPEFNERDTVNAELGEVLRQMNRGKIFTITVTNPATKINLINALNNLTEVLYAESNGVSYSNIIPIDGRFGQQWNMRNTLVNGADIHLDGATNIFTGNPNSIIAIIDNGVDRVHNDLDTKIIGGDNGFQIQTDALGRQFSHGSHVAGISGALSNNAGNNGVAGVDWQARIHPKNIFDGNGDPDITTSIIDAVNFNNNVWTLNNSWGLIQGIDEFGTGIPGRYSITVRSAFAHAYRNNRVSCIAMGNHQVASGGRYANAVSFPAGFNTGSITVGASDVFDNNADFSAQGQHIDVVAPGVGILSTNFNNNYIDLQGTSMAAPHVAGLASLLKGFNTNLANDDIEQIIRLSADDANAAVGFPGFDNQMGTGRINAERALQFLQAPNTVQHLSATGGTVFSTSGNMTRIFLGVPGLADAAYNVRRSEVRTNVIFPAMCNIIGVWGRGVGTTGFREENGRNFGEGICEVVPGTLTNTGATLRTWIYEVWSASGQYIGFHPRVANNVVFQYTILGIPAASQINGDDAVCITSNVYSINNFPVGATVNWQATPNNIVIINSPTSPQTTITRITDGVVTLTANISNSCGGGNLSLTKSNIIIGNPQAFIIFENDDPLCINERYPRGVKRAFIINPLPNSTYQWRVNGVVRNGNSSTFSVIHSWSQLGTNTLEVRVFRCGAWVSSGMIEYEAIYCEPGSNQLQQFVITPNPVSNQLNIKHNKEKFSKINAVPEIKEIIITDKFGNIKMQQKLSNPGRQLSVTIGHFKVDIYFVKIWDGKEWQTLKFLKE